MGQPTPAPRESYPLTAGRNPQQDLFPQLVLFDPARRVLSCQAWERQESLLLRNLGTRAAQEAVQRASRIRPAPGTAPRNDSYGWDWPSYTSLAFGLAAPARRLPEFVLTYLQDEEQLQALGELLQEIGQEIGFALSRPSPVYATAETVRVEFLDCIAWVANRAERELLQELRDGNGNWQPSTRGFDLDYVLGDGRWLEQVLRPWLPTIDYRFGDRAVEAHRLLLRDLRRHFLDQRFIRATCKQVLQCLCLDGASGRVLPRIRRYRPAAETTNLTYNALWQRAEHWRELERHSPQLAPFSYLAGRYGIATEDGNLGQLRDACRARGLTPAGWRFLCRHGDQAFAGWLQPEDTAAARPPFGSLIAWIQWQAEAGLQRPLPAAFARVVRAAGVVAQRQDLSYAVALDARLGRVAATSFPADPRPAHAELAEWQQILTWLAVAQPRFDRNQWRSGWPLLRRAHRDWLVRLAKAQWDSAVGPFSADGWAVRPLTSGKELAAEAERLEHCVVNYVDRCLAGSYRVFTVEHPDTGQSVATIGLTLAGGKWALEQVRGRRNAEPPPQALVLGLAVRQRLKRAAEI